MKIISFTPYALQTREAGLITMIANYMRAYDLPVTQIRCNGVVPTCDRDASEGWQRSATSCLSCMAEQSKLGRWGEQQVEDLSPYVTPADVDDTKRWMLRLGKLELLGAEFEGLPLSRYCRSSFNARFGTDRPDIMNRATELTVRRMLLSAARMTRAVRRFAQTQRPDYALIASGEDYLSAAFSASLRDRRVKVSVFAWNKINNEIVVENPVSGKVASYPLVFDDITQLRKDLRTWPTELTRLLEEVLAFIDLAPSQVSLPLAR